MKIRVQFVADCELQGGRITKDDLVQAFVEWIYDQDESFGDSLVDYIPEEIEFDHFSMAIDNVRIS